MMGRSVRKYGTLQSTQSKERVRWDTGSKTLLECVCKAESLQFAKSRSQGREYALDPGYGRGVPFWAFYFSR